MWLQNGCQPAGLPRAPYWFGRVSCLSASCCPCHRWYLWELRIQGFCFSLCKWLVCNTFCSCLSGHMSNDMERFSLQTCAQDLCDARAAGPPWSVTPSVQPRPLGPESNEAKPPKAAAAKWLLADVEMPCGLLLPTSEEKLMSCRVFSLFSFLASPSYRKSHLWVDELIFKTLKETSSNKW